MSSRGEQAIEIAVEYRALPRTARRSLRRSYANARKWTRTLKHERLSPKTPVTLVIERAWREGIGTKLFGRLGSLYYSAHPELREFVDALLVKHSLNAPPAPKRAQRAKPRPIMCPTCGARSRKISSQWGGLQERVCANNHHFEIDTFMGMRRYVG